MTSPSFATKIFVLAAIGLLLALMLRPASSRAVSEITRVMGPPAPASGNGWVDMPAGARPAYIGIHGGTVPVSLLASSDGQSMVTFVGRTGNDFLSILHKTGIRPPLDEEFIVQPPNSNATVLMADTPIGAIPVFYATGKGFARMDLTDGQWLPFGLTDKPLLLEGQAVKPLKADEKNKRIRRMLLMQQRLQRPVLSTR